MPTRSQPARRHRHGHRYTILGAVPALTAVRLLPVLGLVTVAAVIGIDPAGAHSILVATTPGPGDRIEALTEVRLDFAGGLAPDGHLVTVQGPTGAPTSAAGYERPEPNTLVARFTVALADGDHEIVWEAVAADGHHETGRIPVTVIAPAPPAPPTTTSVTPTTTGRPSPTEPAGGGATADQPGAQAPAEVAAGEGTGATSGDDSSAWVIGLVAAGAAAVAAVAVAYRRRAGSADR